MKITRNAIIALIAIAAAWSASARPGGPGGPGQRGGGFGGPFGLEPTDIVGAIFAKYDTDADNLLSAAEIEASVAAKIEARQAALAERGVERTPPEGFTPPTSADMTARILENHDTDGDEALSVDEVLATIEGAKRQGPRGGKGKLGNRPRGPRGPANDDSAE